jgi:hypothetical protein
MESIIVHYQNMLKFDLGKPLVIRGLRHIVQKYLIMAISQYILRFSLLVLIFSGISYSLQAQDQHWYFGSSAGIVFDQGTASVVQGFNTMYEGSACISDSSGNLLFYTNGMQVWNANHNVMLNTTASAGPLNGSLSSTQCALIAPRPFISNQYYIFTTDANGGSGNLSYSVVNMDQNNGLGDVINFNKNTLLMSSSTEKLTTIPHANGLFYWVVGHKYGSNVFNAFLVTGWGVGTDTTVSIAGSAHLGGGTGAYHGYMKASPDGSLLACALEGDEKLELFSFDRNTGVISHIATSPVTIESAYGIEFSPDGQHLYASQRYGNNVYQWTINNLSPAALNNPILLGTFSSNGGAIQLAPDGKLYLARDTKNFLSVIHYPDSSGFSCMLVDTGLYLTSMTVSNAGLPNNHHAMMPEDHFSIVTSVETCVGALNGTAELIIENNAAIDSVVWDNGSNNPSISGLSGGIYNCTVYLGYNTAISRTAVVAMDSGLNVTYNSTLPSSLQPSGGSIQLMVNNGQSPYSYSWNNGSILDHLSGLVEGLYQVTIIDDNNCIETLSINLPEQAVPDWHFSTSSGIHQIYIPETAGLTIGTDSIVAGDYIGVFYDSLGILACGGYLEWIGSSNVLIAYEDFAPGPILNNGFQPGEQFYWKIWQASSNLAFTANPVYDTLFSNQGNFVLNGLSGISELNVNTVPLLAFDIETTDIDCHGHSNGAAIIINLIGTSPFSYTWSTGDTTISAGNLPPGNYSVSVSDFFGFIEVEHFIITDPPILTNQFTILNSNSAQAVMGTAIAATQGGVPPYDFSWSNGQQVPMLNQLSAGSYTLSIVDAIGCELVDSVEITDIASSISLDATAELTYPSCFGACDGAIDLSMAGGVSPYQAYWSSGVFALSLSGLCSGIYDVTVLDNSGGISTSLPWTYTNTATSHFISLSNTATLYGITPETGDYMGVFYESGSTLYCAGYDIWTAGSMIMTAWADDPATPIQDGFANADTIHIKLWKQSNGNIYSLDATYNNLYPYQGTFHLYGVSQITSIDATLETAGSFKKLSFELFDPDPLMVFATQSDYNGYATSYMTASDAWIAVDSISGIAPYSYVWSNGVSGTDSISGLPAGIYELTVTDDTGCQVIETFELIDPPLVPLNLTPVVTEVSCYGYSDASIIINISGGIPPYSYLWSTGDTTQNISALPAGSYHVTVSDSYNQTFINNFYLQQAPSIGIAAAINNLSSLFANDGSIDLTIQGSGQQFSYLWSTGDTIQDLVNIGAGDYYLTIANTGSSCSETHMWTIDYGSTVPVGNITDTIPEFVEYMMEGSCANLDVFNVVYTGYTASIGTFLAGNNFVLDSGIVLSTGFVDDLNGPSYLTQTSSATAGTSDSILASIYPFDIHDAASIEYDFIATQDTFKLEYVFASDEYPYNVSTADDPVRILISGPAPPGNAAYENYNLSQVPGGLPVGIPTVNQWTNSNYYVTNAGLFGEFNGLTIPLLATVAIVPGQPYHIKVVVADGVNDSIDSGIYFKTYCHDNGYSMNGTMLTSDVSCNGNQDGLAFVIGLNGAPPYQYFWSTGDTTATLDSLQAGLYDLTVWDAANQVTVLPFEILEAEPIIIAFDDSICVGETYYFGNLYLSNTGNYTDTLISVNGCDSIVHLNLIVNPLPAMYLDSPVNDTILIVSGTFTLPAGYPSGGIYYGIGVTGNQFDPSVAGIGTHQIYYEFTDEHGCSNTDSIVYYILPNDFNEILANRYPVIIYPNPGSGLFFIQNLSTEPIDRIKILDVSAKEITVPVNIRQTDNETHELDLRNLAPGIYLIQISGKTRHELRKIILQRN